MYRSRWARTARAMSSLLKARRSTWRVPVVDTADWSVSVWGLRYSYQ